jgi:acetate kinase
MPDQNPSCAGLVDRIGIDQSSITHHPTRSISDHEAAQGVTTYWSIPKKGFCQQWMRWLRHRVVHGGETFSSTTLINEAVKEEIKALFSLANYLGITVAERMFPKAMQVAVFDTAFHQSMPPRAYRYAQSIV